MIGLVYLSLLLGSLGCMLLLDWRFRLFFWRDWPAAALVTGLGTLFFLVWDVFGIMLGIFFRGQAAVATGVVLGPEMPLEEPVFLIFLVVCTMVIYTGTIRLLTAGRLREATA